MKWERQGMALPSENNAAVDHVNLLCTEDDAACFFDDDDGDDDAAEDAGADCLNEDSHGQGFTMFVEEEHTPSELQLALNDLFDRERQYTPQADFTSRMQNTEGMDATSRKKAASWLLKMREVFKFTAYTASLSINYLDRFLSLRQLPSGKAWTMQLLSVACLSLAVKMEEIEAPMLVELQVGADLMFEPRIVQRMELLVLSTLGWRMSSVTPVSYTNYFISGSDLAFSFKRILTSRANELILSSALDSRFLQFSSSSIAAAATLSAFQETLPVQAEEQRRYLLRTLPHQSQVELPRCCARMAELLAMARCSAAMKEAENSVPQSPVAVLDASFSSNSLSTSTLNCHSCLPISSPSPPKKRRVDEPPP